MGSYRLTASEKLAVDGWREGVENGERDVELNEDWRLLADAIRQTREAGVRKHKSYIPLPMLEAELRATEDRMVELGMPIPADSPVKAKGGTKMPRKTTHDTWTLVDTVLKVAPRALLYGDPGTGKTHAALRCGFRRAGQNVHTVTLTEESAAADLRGMFLPKGGEFVFHDGPAVRAMRNGDRLVINEVDHASPDVWSFLLAALDDFDMIAETLPSGETIRASDGYHVVATMNGKPEDLPEALADRFTVRIPITKPNPAAFEALPEHLRQVAEATSTKTDHTRIGLRSWITFAELSAKLDNEAAARAVFGERWEAILDSLDARSSA